ncbi:MAG TPA: guanylate kinase [Planctomycetaceae bacterium]|nr:guanylate kinase [Planctomycetaceae bacterium]
MSMQPGRLLIVSGPSGVGKGTLLRRVMERSKQPLTVSVSATTRPPRAGERHAIDYYFLTRDEFQRRREAGEFLECFEVYAGGNWYGTLAAPVEERLREGKWVVLEIDFQGAETAKRLCPEAITIFIEPQNMDVLHERLLGRGSENDESLRKRLERAEAELAAAGQYDYRIVNDDLDAAVERFCRILESLERKDRPT